MTSAPVTKAPLVSVLMPVHNAAPYLDQSIGSVLGQSFGDFEFIIIDDASTDGSAEIVAAAAGRDPRVRVISHREKLGLSRSVNLGLELARGRFLARQDADDISRAQRFVRQLALLEARPDLVLVGSAYRAIDPEGRLLAVEHPPREDSQIRWQMLFHNAFAHSSVIMRADVLHRHRLRYDERLRYAQDYDFWSRLMAYGAVANCAEPLVEYRVHGRAQRPEMYREQQETANGIAKRNLAACGFPLSDAEVARLREHFTGTAPDLATHDLLLQIISRLASHRSGAAASLAVVRMRLVLGALALRKKGVGCRDLAALCWGLFRLGGFSFMRAAGAASLSRVGGPRS